MEDDILTRIKSLPKKQLDRIREVYLQQEIRKARPDLTFLVEVMMMTALTILLYYLVPYISGTVIPNFNGAQLARAQNATTGSFGLKDVTKVEMEVSSYKKYQDYFKSNPNSGDNTGLHDLMVTSAMAPLAMFFLTYILPPFVIAYILWFIVKFWKYVIKALWGWFLAMYEYFTTLVQGKLGCKWYIRMVTGWKCRSVAFSDIVEKWRIRYVDRPVYYEKLRYVKQFMAAKEQYIDRPINRYINFPLRKYGIYADYAKKLYMERPMDELIRRIKETPDANEIATIVVGSDADKDVVWSPKEPEVGVNWEARGGAPNESKSQIIAITITALLIGLLINIVTRGYVTSLIINPQKHLLFGYIVAGIIGTLVIVGDSTFPQNKR